MISPLETLVPIEFDDMRHTIDVVAYEYLKQASKRVQHLIPVKVLGDGNCLFNSIVSVMPDSDISAVELRGSSRLLNIHKNVSNINLTT